MKKRILMILGVAVLVSLLLVGCKDNVQEQDGTTGQDGYNNAVDEYEFVVEDVTDEDGKQVTDAEGNKVTTQVLKPVTTKKSDKTTKKSDKDKTKDDKSPTLTTEATKPTESTTVEPAESTTNPVLTTLPVSKDIVPSISATGNVVTFSNKDQQTIKNMLEVPYLYESNYESKNGVPIEAATHVALWMLQNDNISSNSFPSETIVLDLFKYFGQTVVNFKTKCNDEGNNGNITYSAASDSFTVTSFEKRTHTVEITEFQDLGNNNYYKVIAKVSGANGVNSVTAIVQKNKLDSSLGFSIKALKWS